MNVRRTQLLPKQMMNTKRVRSTLALASALLTVSGASGAVDISVNHTVTTTVPYTFDSGKALLSIHLQPDTNFGRVLSSTVTMDGAFLKAPGDIVAPLLDVNYRHELIIGMNVSPGYGSQTFSAGSLFSEQMTLGVYNIAVKGSEPYVIHVDPDSSRYNTIVVSEAPQARIDDYIVANPLAIKGDARGVVMLRANYSVAYRTDTFFDTALGWLQNVSEFNAQDYVVKMLREYVQEKSEHAERSTNSLYIRPPRNGGPGIRGDATFTGFKVHTASPGILAYDVTLPDTAFIDVPIAFIKNNMEATLDVAFEGESLMTFHGSDYLTDEIQMLNIDISGFEGRQGLLTFTVNTDGPESAEIFVADNLSLRGFQVTALAAAVPEPGSYALMLAGLAVLGARVRRRRQHGA
ncbi:MAG: PEP-CTERM sorting domain-containing protein [Methyloversatilis sp.]|uniref:PEP-CTERM sorting domain-containing protein n=1 Tax=Methyloversatilis sp. TaxID=2569862 RepID=UPI0027323220|nr:PEP-CTERM sorting domain-containing protein [Methyloversatilis sp.]MDP3872498.1 PEP-CTERM sorting domain-containing protein [Methyloversatilis sp.]